MRITVIRVKEGSQINGWSPCFFAGASALNCTQGTIDKPSLIRKGVLFIFVERTRVLIEGNRGFVENVLGLYVFTRILVPEKTYCRKLEWCSIPKTILIYILKHQNYAYKK